VITAALTAGPTGCSVEVTGSAGPMARPIAGPVGAPVNALGQGTSSRETRVTSHPTDVSREWIAAGWSPAPLTPVTDSASRISASMFGPGRTAAPGRPPGRQGGVPGDLGGPASVVTFLIVTPPSPGETVTAEEVANSGAAVEGRSVTDCSRSQLTATRASTCGPT
jgi:hypothetical protein